MKKFMLLPTLSLSFLLSACSSSPVKPIEFTESTPTSISVGTLKGPTGMGMVQLMSEEHEHLSFEILSSPDQIAPKLVSGELDIAAVPANLASVLYQNTNGNLKVLAINTLGVLYIVENGHTITDIQDLRGKTIYASGKGSTPEYALNYILEKNNIADEVTIEWKSEHTECVMALQSSPSSVAMLPEPFVTTSKLQFDTLTTVLDLTEEWEKTGATSQLITGVLVGNTDFFEENQEAVDDFLAEYKDSTTFINTNIEEGAALVDSYEIVPESAALLSIANSNITYIDGEEMASILSAYLEVLFEQNPAAVGGSLPPNDFYYVP